MSLQQCLNTILEYSLGNIGRPIKQSYCMVDFSYWTAYSLVTTLVRVNGHAIYCHKGEKLKTMFRQNFGRRAKSIMVFLKKKGPIAIEHKTYTALHATSLANHTAGFPDERRRILCRADKAANRKFDWCNPTRLAIRRCNGGFLLLLLS